MSTPSHDTRTATTRPPYTPGSDAESFPATIGEYRIRGVLGEGGMGVVYEAEQDQPRRTVALKVIRPEIASPDRLRRFARESEALARLQHPGIAQIYEAGTAEGPDGGGPQPFFAMELVRGAPLGAHAADWCRTDAERLELFARVCDAVHHAHQQGIIHRDLKPANILVDAHGQPKVLDFGVARFTDADTDGRGTRTTALGEVVGTLQYMSPEQVSGDPLDVDTRSDIYALGLILYELLAGRRPYDVGRKPLYEVLRIIVADEPPTLGSLDRRLRGDLETIVAKALEKDKQRRYASAAELAADVRRYLRDEPVSARPASAAYQLAKLARRHRGLVGGLAVAALVLVAGAVVSATLAVRARREAAKATAVNAFLQEMLGAADPEVAQGRTLTVKDVADEAAARLREGRLATEPEVRAEVHATLGRVYLGAGAYDLALRHLDSAQALRRGTPAAAGESAVETMLDIASAYDEGGKRDTAEVRFREALAAAERLRPPHAEQIVFATRRLALLAQTHGREAEAESLAVRALAIARRISPAPNRSVVDALQELAKVRDFSGRYAAGEPTWREALTLARRLFGERHTTTLFAASGLSYSLLYQGKVAEAESLLRPTLAATRAVYGATHPTTLVVLERLARALDRQGKRAEAEPMLREVLATRLRTLGERHVDVAFARTQLGRLLWGEHRYAEAETLFTQAKAGRAAVLGARHPAVASSLMDLAGVAADRGALADAERAYRDALSIWREAHVERMEQSATSGLGSVLLRGARYPEAEPLLLAAEAAARQGADTASKRSAVQKLVSLYERWGRSDSAAAWRARLP
jgi:tetratricopeptide (TPR) repeat protein